MSNRAEVKAQGVQLDKESDTMISEIAEVNKRKTGAIVVFENGKELFVGTTILNCLFELSEDTLGRGFIRKDINDMIIRKSCSL